MTNIFEWFKEEKLLKKFRALHSRAEKIAGEMAAEIATEQISVADLQVIHEEAIATRATLDSLLELVKLHELKLGAVVASRLEQIELMSDTRRDFLNYVDQTNDAATLAANAGDYFLSSPDAAAKLLTSFNPTVLRTALDILADNEDWETLGMLYDTAKKKLDGK